MAWKSSFRQNCGTTFSSIVPTSATRILHVVVDVEAPGLEKLGHLKSGGKRWQTTPKNLPRLQRTRAIPVACLNSCLCPDMPKGWIPIIVIIIILTIRPEINSYARSFTRHCLPPVDQFDTFLYNKTNKFNSFKNLFWQKSTFRTVPLSIIRSLFTTHSAMLCHTGL